MDSEDDIENDELEGWTDYKKLIDSIHDGAILNEDVSEWLWMVGIYLSKNRVRFVRLQDRTQHTVKIVMNKYVEPGSLVWTDPFASYNKYSLDGYTHQKVNHSENFVDPETGVHTQGMERAWVDAKEWYKRARGNRKYLQSHVNEASRRKLRASDRDRGTLFAAFLNDLRDSFSIAD